MYKFTGLSILLPFSFLLSTGEKIGLLGKGKVCNGP